jgi:hypothetical protein
MLCIGKYKNGVMTLFLAFIFGTLLRIFHNLWVHMKGGMSNCLIRLSYCNSNFSEV